ncbi:MAG TPA: phosphoribosyltransferase family protein [Dehalococcoidia bacterium]
MTNDLRTLIHRHSTLFVDRKEAGKILAASLTEYRGQNALVLAIPRGGVPLAAEVAEAIEGELDVVVARKLGAPGSPELAIGAVTSNGGRYLNEKLIEEIRVSNDYLQRITAAEIHEARRRETRFREDRPAPKIEGRTVIVVDDGLATGATMRASVRSVRKSTPEKLIVAVPVGSRAAYESLVAEADEVLCPHQPEAFFGIGEFYENFEPTEDDEVRRILSEFQASRKTE